MGSALLLYSCAAAILAVTGVTVLLVLRSGAFGFDADDDPLAEEDEQVGPTSVS